MSGAEFGNGPVKDGAEPGVIQRGGNVFRLFPGQAQVFRVLEGGACPFIVPRAEQAMAQQMMGGRGEGVGGHGLAGGFHRFRGNDGSHFLQQGAHEQGGLGARAFFQDGVHHADGLFLPLSGVALPVKAVPQEHGVKEGCVRVALPGGADGFPRFLRLHGPVHQQHGQGVRIGAFLFRTVRTQRQLLHALHGMDALVLKSGSGAHQAHAPAPVGHEAVRVQPERGVKFPESTHVPEGEQMRHSFQHQHLRGRRGGAHHHRLHAGRQHGRLCRNAGAEDGLPPAVQGRAAHPVPVFPASSSGTESRHGGGQQDMAERGVHKEETVTFCPEAGCPAGPARA